MSQKQDKPPLPLSDAQAWAAAQLELSHDGTLASLRAAWLRRLAQRDWTPGLPHRQAAQLFFEIPPPRAADPLDRAVEPASSRPSGLVIDGADDAIAEGYHAHLVERFARGYFAMPPRKRRLRWHDLRSRTLTFPAIQGRLADLKRGLELEASTPERGPSQAAELYDEIVRMFVLSPSARAEARRKLISRVRRQPAVWGAAARWLHRHSDVGLLDPVLIDYLIDWKRIGTYGHVRQFFGRTAFKTASRISQRERAILLGCLLAAVMINAIYLAINAPRKEKAPSPPQYSSPLLPHGTAPPEVLRRRHERHGR